VISFVSTSTSNTKGFLQAGILVLSTLTPNFEGDDTGVFCNLSRIQTAACRDVKNFLKTTTDLQYICEGTDVFIPGLVTGNKYKSEEKEFIIISIETNLLCPSHFPH